MDKFSSKFQFKQPSSSNAANNVNAKNVAKQSRIENFLIKSTAKGRAAKKPVVPM